VKNLGTSFTKKSLILVIALKNSFLTQLAKSDILCGKLVKKSAAVFSHPGSVCVKKL